MNRGGRKRGKPQAPCRPLNDYTPMGLHKTSCRTRRGGGQYYPTAQGRHPLKSQPLRRHKGEGENPHNT